MSHSSSDAHDHSSHGGTGLYLFVFVTLCLLTGASFLTTSTYWPWHDTPKVGWAFMMSVSCVKAMLVIVFFMHLKWEANWKYVLTLPAAFMSVFLVLMLIPDVGRRMDSASRERTTHTAVPKVAEAVGSTTDHPANDKHPSP